MKSSVQNKINELKKKAHSSSGVFVNKGGKSSSSVEDSLAKIITNKTEGDVFIADLNAAIKRAQTK